MDFWLLINEWDMNPDPGDPALIARKVYEFEDGGDFSWSENTVLELRHAPQ